jgi:hypothetical protein
MIWKKNPDKQEKSISFEKKLCDDVVFYATSY